jgi:L-ascorbate metabolism protein UlaG (beta-lactamase superfamily)
MGFRNPQGSADPDIKVVGSIRYLWKRMWAEPLVLGKDVPHDHVIPEDQALAMLQNVRGDSITWLGHSAFLLRIGGRIVLTDPFLTGSVGPLMRGLHRLPLGVPLEAVSRADIVLISHAHFDHLHHPSLRRISGRERMTAIVPKRVGAYVRAYRFRKIVELDWDERTTQGGIEITALPAVHYSEVPGNRTLWASFRIRWRDAGKWRSVYFEGDSGYGPVFADRIRPYGPFDLALLGIGSYYVSGLRADLVHTNPEEAVRIAKDIRAKNIVGMHWGTVRMTDEPPMEPQERLRAAAKEAGFSGQARTLRIGETIAFEALLSVAKRSRMRRGALHG